MTAKVPVWQTTLGAIFRTCLSTAWVTEVACAAFGKGDVRYAGEGSHKFITLLREHLAVTNAAHFTFDGVGYLSTYWHSYNSILIFVIFCKWTPRLDLDEVLSFNHFPRARWLRTYATVVTSVPEEPITHRAVVPNDIIVFKHHS